MSKKTDEFMEDVIDMYGCAAWFYVCFILWLIAMAILPDKVFNFFLGGQYEKF